MDRGLIAAAGHRTRLQNLGGPTPPGNLLSHFEHDGCDRAAVPKHVRNPFFEYGRILGNTRLRQVDFPGDRARELFPDEPHAARVPTG